MAKIPIILEPGRADGKLATSGAIFDENKSMFQSEINDIQDTLNSDNPNKPLSAKQGKILKELLDAKVIEAGAVPIDSEPTEGNITHVVNSDSLAKEFNKCNTAIINTDRIANEAIVPSKLSTDIQSLISNLSKTATFAGIATPTTNPETPEGPVFYIANGKGTYTNFGGLKVTEDEVVLLYYDTAWHKETTGIASNDKVTDLSAEMVIEQTIAMPLIADTAFNAYGIKLGDKFTSTAGSASGVASNSFIVQEGEVYHLKGRGNKYAYKGYFVVNTDDVVIQIIDGNVEYDLDLVIGQGAKNLFVNCVNYNEDVDGVWKVKSESLKDAVLKMRDGENADTIIDTIDLNNKIVVGYAYNLGGNSVGQKYTSNPSTSANSAYIRIAVNHNSKYEIRGKGSQYAYRFYAFLDADLTILELSTDDYNTRNDALVLTPPSNAGILIVNYTNYDASLDSLIRKDSYNVADSIKLISKPLNGTNIVCFGDSITQFKSIIGMRYSDYLEENGANVVNVGIGGTQIRQRATPSASPTSVEQAYGGLDMVSLVNAAASNDYSIVEASASYIQSNATPQYNPIDVIEKLKSIDWNKVGIVTILGGTNDWNNGNNLGEATDENATSTLGALNHIIKTLLTAYPHLRVYVFTPLVRYVASSLAERTDATWAGKMTNGEGKTILDYVDAIKYVAENNCISVCDMYRTLGWNKWNFSQYFNDDDGVHPYKGFKEIADRIQSFILANL